jgi:hypothetical protein
MRQLSLAVVGADHPNKRGPGRRFEIAVCAPGEAVRLEREPKNKADENAVAVYSARDVQLGYLRAEQAPWIGGMLLNGREVRAVFQRSSQFGCWVRAAFDGAKPSVTGLSEPPATSVHRSPEEGAWYPDEIYPDE